MHFGGNIPLDVLFLLDSTGSMADEIHQIKSTLHSTARQVSNLPSNPQPEVRNGELQGPGR